MNTLHEEPAAQGSDAEVAERSVIISPDGNEDPRAMDDEGYSLDIGWKDLVFMFFAVIATFSFFQTTLNRDGWWYPYGTWPLLGMFLYRPVKDLTAWVVKRVREKKPKSV
ncbi:MAG: hypothetical protein IPP94_18680 [Ignavibacteria bacterium]|nr:hypothetical protein [Ignavibacteria bacterium]